MIAMATTKRSDAQYEIEALSKALAVLEVVVEDEPIKEPLVVRKTKLSRDFVHRALRTFRLRGYLVRNDRDEWICGRLLIRVATKVARRHEL